MNELFRTHVIDSAEVIVITQWRHGAKGKADLIWYE